MVKELKSSGYHGGEAGHVIFKCDGESSIQRVRDKLGMVIEGKVVLEDTPKGESQSNGAAEEAGKQSESLPGCSET